MHLNELIGLSSLCHTSASLAFIKSLEYDDTLDNTDDFYEWLPPDPVIPNELANPPPFRYDFYYIEPGTNVIKARDPVSVYIPNYRAQDVFDGVRSLKPTATYEERVRHGAVTMLQRMIKLRGASIQESFMIAVLSYKCSQCVRMMGKSESAIGVIKNDDHVCLFRSNSMRWLSKLFSNYIEFPFLITRDGVKFATNCGSVSTQIPLLFFQFLEQMILTGDGTYSSTLEGFLCAEWIDRARTGLFSEMFKRRKVITLLREAIFRRSDLLNYR
nr:MAG: RNA-dependent RNA polymerase [Reoviridae sp.]